LLSEPLKDTRILLTNTGTVGLCLGHAVKLCGLGLGLGLELCGLGLCLGLEFCGLGLCLGLGYSGLDILVSFTSLTYSPSLMLVWLPVSYCSAFIGYAVMLSL